MDNEMEQASLAYHAKYPAGKVATRVTKPCRTQNDLSLAYSPGVATPCDHIYHSPEDVWAYTAKGNTVAVVSDGSAVLGLGNIGPAAGLPVMEGKAVLFKSFADIDAVPICLKAPDGIGTDRSTYSDWLVSVAAALEPTYGGINLEDIAAPYAFSIEESLKEKMNIPVFHDDQHGTAIISLAGVLNALQIVGKRLDDVKIVVNGAGAAGIACTDFYIAAGARPENVVVCDSKGVINAARENLSPEKARMVNPNAAGTLADALVGADVFLGLSVKDCVTEEMVRSMQKDPIIFAMANPDPEIVPEKAFNAGAAVIGTGRSDYPNQVNNVLGFPGIFRGALDARAATINESMKVAASKALAELTCERFDEGVRDYLAAAYPEDAANRTFDGANPLKANYVIPKPFDPRVVPRVARRVYEAAWESGITRVTELPDMDAYEAQVRQRLNEAGEKM